MMVYSKHGAWQKMAIGLLWLALISYGFKLIFDFKTTPGAQGNAPANWPSSSQIQPKAGLATLVLFAHPQCPCTRASLSELNQIMHQGQHVQAYVMFMQPSNGQITESWTRAGLIPHTERLTDRQGVEATRFGAMTSGHVVLYNAQGQLQFAGGITDSRGHEGNNMGRQMVLNYLSNIGLVPAWHATFGCALQRVLP